VQGCARWLRRSHTRKEQEKIEPLKIGSKIEPDLYAKGLVYGVPQRLAHGVPLEKHMCHKPQQK